jgi:hypothetical protein
MNPVRLRGYTPDEFERICLELALRTLGATNVTRRGGISDPDQGIDIEANSGSVATGIQCKTGKVTVPLLRESIRQLIRYPKRLDRFVLMCAQHPMPGALDEFRHWASSAQTVAGPIGVVELWDPDRLATLLGAHPDILASLSRAPAAVVFAVPASRLEAFVGRRDALTRLDEWVQDRTPRAAAVSVVGMGGIGKTSLALEFAHSRRDQFAGGVYWFNGQEPLLTQCARFGALNNSSAAPDTPEPAAARAFLKSLESNKPALIIIDDLDRPNLINEPIVDSLPLSDTGARVLVTSRFAGLTASRVWRLELGTLDDTQAVELLGRASNRHGLLEAGAAERSDAVQLCRSLGSLPLAIQIAGAYLALHPDTSIPSYLALLTSEGAATGVDESEADALRLQDRRSASITASLRLAYDAIRDDGARRLFNVLCMLPADYAVDTAALAFFVGESNQKGPHVTRALAWLVNSGFVRVDNEEHVVVHPLARSFGESLLDDRQRRALAAAVAGEASQGLLRLLDPSQQVEPVHHKPIVFLCYAGPDRAMVDDLYERLSRDGFSPWMDKRSLLPGQEWQLEIKRTIEKADYFIACISKRFQEKTYANKEIKHALDVLDMMPEGAIYLVPLRLEECPVQDRLASRQWVDLFVSDGYQRLVHALRFWQGRPVNA